MADKHPAEALADKIHSGQTQWENLIPALDMLRTIPALEAERDALHEARFREAAGMGLEIEELKAERDALRAKVTVWSTTSAVTEAERNELRAEVKALREDAERYRWLRTFPNNIAPSVYGRTMVAESGLLRRDTYLDEAIDAARKQQ